MLTKKIQDLIQTAYQNTPQTPTVDHSKSAIVEPTISVIPEPSTKEQEKENIENKLVNLDDLMG